MNLAQRLGTAINLSLSARTDSGRQLGDRVRMEIERLEPEVFEMWQTADDERTCPICGQLDGSIWRVGEGFTPPIHDHCRCQRIYHHAEFGHRSRT